MEYGLDMVKLAYMAGSNGRTMTKTKFFRTDEWPYFLSYPWCSARVLLARGALLEVVYRDHKMGQCSDVIQT